MSGRGRIVVGIGAVAAALVLWRVTQPSHAPTWRLTQLTFDTGLTGWPAISADGKVVAYASDRDGGKNLDLYVQQVSGGATLRLTETPEDESEPSISPDGKTVAYHSTKDGGGVYIMPSTGGAPRLLVSGGHTPRYSPDGRWIAYRTDAGAYVISSGGGMQRQLYPRMAATGAPVWSPDSKRLIFTAGSGIWVGPPQGDQPQATGLPERLAETGLSGALPADANWTADGLIFTARNGFARDLYRCPLDAHGRASGAITRITTGTELIGEAAATRVGRVAFTSGRQRFDIWALPLNGNSGKLLGPPVRITDSLAPIASPFLSEDGSKLLFNSSLHGFAEVWLKDLNTGIERVAATGPTGATGGRFLRGSGRVSYSRTDGLYLLDLTTGKSGKLGGGARTLWDTDRAEKDGLVTGAADGADLLDLATGQLSPLLRAPEHAPISQLSFSRDDRWILFLTTNGTAANRIYAARASGSQQILFAEWRPVTDGSGKVDKPRFSPDGKLVYYTLDRGEVRTIQAVAFDADSGRTEGSPFAVFDGGPPRLSLGGVNRDALELGVAANKLVVNFSESSFNIWIADPVPCP